MQSPSHEVLGDSIAWGGCTIMYLLGQQLHFELFDFSYQVLNVAEVEGVSPTHAHKNPPSLQVKHGANFVIKSSPTRRQFKRLFRPENSRVSCIMQQIRPYNDSCKASSLYFEFLLTLGDSNWFVFLFLS